MTHGLGFLLAMLTEGALAAALGWWLASHLKLSRFSGSVRCCAASVISTGVTHPVLWLWFSRWVDITGSWWGVALSALALGILAEGLIYAAVLRGHWRLSLALSAVVNIAGFGAALLLNWLLAKPA
ncbi:MAG TPA: hypothetical protein VG742_19430 [Dongiaceae bacterium]|nr:hypothetical protein [Dongiaceae bacterium]